MLSPLDFEASCAFAAVALGDWVAAVFAAPRAGIRPFAVALVEELPDCELAAAAALVADPSADRLVVDAELSDEPEDPLLELAEGDLLALESEPFAAGPEDLLCDEAFFVELLPSLVAARSMEKISVLGELAELERFVPEDEVLGEELPILNATGQHSIGPRML
jgi:hypothetical protein